MITELLAAKRSQMRIKGTGPPLNPSAKEKARSEDAGFALVPEELFRKALSMERKRSERSRQRFVLMLVHVGEVLATERGVIVLEGITEELFPSARGTDLHGWYENGSVVGVICTEIGKGDLDTILSALQSRVGAAWRSRLELEQGDAIHISFHVYPDDLDLKKGGRSTDTSLDPDLRPQYTVSTSSQPMKRRVS
jgi:hypothetical protein